MCAGHNIHREELLRLARAGLTYTLTEPPTHFEFAAWGLGHFTGKLAQVRQCHSVQSIASGRTIF